MPTPAEYLSQPVGARILVLGDSNIVSTAYPLVEAGNLSPTESALMNFGATMTSSGLRDLSAILTRISALDMGDYDAAIINWGMNDVSGEAANWAAFAAGTYPSPGGMSYRARILAVLDALDPLPVWWLGMPSGLPTNQWDPNRLVEVNLSIATYDPAWEMFLQAFSLPTAPNARMHFVYVESLLGSISPRFLDGVHYSAPAASAIFQPTVAAILAAL